MRLIFFIMLFSVLGCQNPQTNSGPVQDTCLSISHIADNMELMPQKVLDYLKTNLTDWEIPDTSEYIKVWWTFYDRDQIPYYVTTDFNDDRLADHAFILENSNFLKLLFLVSSGDTFTHWVVDDFKETYYGNNLKFGLLIRPPGRTDRVVENIPVSLILKSNGIALMEEEIMIRIYYWDNGRFKVFNTE